METIESLKSKGFKSSENVRSESENQSENDCLVVEKECDKKENSKVIVHGMFKLNVSQCVSPISIHFSSVRRPRHRDVIWKKKGSSDTSNVGVESSETVICESKIQSENDCFVVEKECDNKENSKVIASEMFKLNVSQCVSPISMSKSSCDSNNVEIKLKRKRHTFSNVRRPKNSSVIWKKKGSSNTSNV
nr:hypothetical protein [Tanacetum cinerariifolium]